MSAHRLRSGALPHGGFRFRTLCLVLGASLLSITSACVLPQENAANTLEDIPPELFVSTTTIPISNEPEPEEPSFALSLFWHYEDGRLVEVPRQLDTPPTFENALTALVQGPTDEELLLDGGIISRKVVDALGPVAVMTDNQVLVITVDDAYGFRDRDSDKVPITEELVCTLTGISGVTAIRIHDSQGEIDLSDFENQPITAAATRSDFGNCLVQDPSPDPKDLVDPEGAEAQDEPETDE